MATMRCDCGHDAIVSVLPLRYFRVRYVRERVQQAHLCECADCAVLVLGEQWNFTYTHSQFDVRREDVKRAIMALQRAEAGHA